MRTIEDMIRGFGPPDEIREAAADLGARIRRAAARAAGTQRLAAMRGRDAIRTAELADAGIQAALRDADETMDLNLRLWMAGALAQLRRELTEREDAAPAAPGVH
jgi:hypothetical protein